MTAVAGPVKLLNDPSTLNTKSCNKNFLSEGFTYSLEPAEDSQFL